MDAAARFEEANRERLARCREAVAAGDDTRVRALLHELHWFAHDDPAIHVAVHRIEWALARRDGDAGAALRSVLPNLFADPIARLERLAPRYHAEAFVAAPRQLVYDVIADLPEYPAWNPWLLRAEGGVREGDTVLADVVLRDRTISADHEVVVAVPGERFAWRDRGAITVLAGGRRMRVLVDEAGGTRFIVRLALSGPLAGLVHLLLGRSLAAGLEAETRALAARVDSLVRGGARA